MSRVRTFFLEEAAECLAILTSSPPAESRAGALHAAARRLRGNAQLARYRPVAEVALRLEHRLKRLRLGREEWTDETAQVVNRDVAAVARTVDAVRDGRIERECKPEVRMEEQQVTADVEVAIEELEYTGPAALARAVELRAPLEDAIAADEAVGPLMDELFDLIRMGMV